MTPGYVLSSYAEADLREIARYTRNEWGVSRTRTYLAQLKQGIEALVSGQCAFKDMSGLYPSLRMVRCKHHYVICLPRDDAPAIIVAILHERMDLMTRLKGRLE